MTHHLIIKTATGRHMPPDYITSTVDRGL